MNLRDLIFSQQSNLSLDVDNDVSNVNDGNDEVDVSGFFPFTQLSNKDEDFLPPEFAEEHNKSSPFSQSNHSRAKFRLSYDNRDYYKNLIADDDDGPFLHSQPSQEEESDGDAEVEETEDEENNNKKVKKKSKKKSRSSVFVGRGAGMRRRATKYFSRTPNPTNGGKYYQNSPEFIFHNFITYNDNSLQEYMMNHLSFVKFPQFEESFFSFQRKMIQELLLRCYYGKDIDGFIQVRIWFLISHYFVI